MKTELQFLTDTLSFSRTGGVSLSDIRGMMMDRIEDLNLGYSKEDANEIKMVERIQEGMQTIDDSHMVKQLIS